MFKNYKIMKISVTFDPFNKILTPSILIKITHIWFECKLWFISIKIMYNMKVCVNYEQFHTCFLHMTPLKRDVTLLDFGYFPWLTRLIFMGGMWWHITLIYNVRYQKKRNESDIKLNFQNLVSFMIIGTKSSKSWGLLRNIFATFINLSIFVREYRTRKPGIPHYERYVTKPQTSHNTMQ